MAVRMSGLAVFCAIVIFASVHCFPSDLSRWKEHKIRVNNFKCADPRPRRFSVSELFGDLQEDIIEPWQTVLHRCDESSGCCQDKEKTCKVQKSEMVELVFFVTVEPFGFLKRQAENHTLCSCQAKDDTIK